MKHFLSFVLCLLVTVAVTAQTDDLLTRLQGIRNSGFEFYSIDGHEISVHSFAASLTPKDISKKVKRIKIRAKDLASADPYFSMSNYAFTKPIETVPGLGQYGSYYFLQADQKQIMAFTFVGEKHDRDFEHRFIDLYLKKGIPEHIYAKNQIDSILFAGRYIQLGCVCHWSGVNNVQCTRNGQMNWSIHKTLESAELTINNHFQVIKEKRHGKILKDETVDVLFEGTPTTARRIIFDFKGLASALAAMSGAKTLTIYFVAAPVRGNYISAVMSFWDTDYIRPSGMAPLLEEVMQLK